MAKQPVKVMTKNRFRALALPLANASGLRPSLESGDYILFPIHDGTQAAIRVSRDTYVGHAEIRSNSNQWYSLDVALEYPDTDPEAPSGSKIHYMFKFHTPFKVSYSEMKRYVNRVLEELYDLLGRGIGSVYASIIPQTTVEKLIAKGAIEESVRPPEEIMNFAGWSIGFTDDLHYVEPADIPEWAPEPQVAM